MLCATLATCAKKPPPIGGPPPPPPPKEILAEAAPEPISTPGIWFAFDLDFIRNRYRSADLAFGSFTISDSRGGNRMKGFQMTNVPPYQSGQSRRLATIQRLLGLAIVAGAALSLAFTGKSFQYGGRHWEGITLPLAIACGGLMALVGPGRRALYNALLAASFLLLALSWAFLLSNRL